MKKLFALFLIILLSMFSIFSINSVSANGNKEFIEITPTHSIFNWFRGITTSYDVSYLFRYAVESERSYYIEGPSVCFETDPEMDGNPPTGNAFIVNLKRDSLFGGYLGQKTLYGSGGYQLVKWNNVGSGHYKLNFGRGNGQYYDYTYFSDENARIFNCN